MADKGEGVWAGSDFQREKKKIEEKKKDIIEDQAACKLCSHYLYSKLVLRSPLKRNPSPGSRWPLDRNPGLWNLLEEDETLSGEPYDTICMWKLMVVLREHCWSMFLGPQYIRHIRGHVTLVLPWRSWPNFLLGSGERRREQQAVCH